MDQTAYRRRFLKFLATSPLLAFGVSAWRDGGAAASDAASGIPKRILIASPNEALNVFDFESVARQKLPPAHFGYMATGVDDDATLRANREGFSRFQIRPRRLVDVSGWTRRRSCSASPGGRRSFSPRWAARRRSIPRARSRSRGPRGPEIICRFSPPRPQHLSRTSRRRAGGRSGISSIRRTRGG